MERCVSSVPSLMLLTTVCGMGTVKNTQKHYFSDFSVTLLGFFLVVTFVLVWLLGTTEQVFIGWMSLVHAASSTPHLPRPPPPPPPYPRTHVPYLERALSTQCPLDFGAVSHSGIGKRTLPGANVDGPGRSPEQETLLLLS